MVLGSPQGLHTFAVFAAFSVDVFGNRRGADKADGLDARVGQQRVHRFLVAVDNVKHAGWQTGFQRQLRDAQRAAGIALRGLQHKGVATSHGHGPHPQRHHSGEVEGGDAGCHAQGLEFAPRVNGGADVFAVLALQQLGRVASVFHIFDATLQFTSGVRQHLAMLGSDQRAQFFRVLLQQNLEVTHDAGALQWWRVAPGGESRLRGRNGLLHGGLVGQQQTLFGATGGRVVDALGARTGIAVGQLAVDQVANGGELGHGVSKRCLHEKYGFSPRIDCLYSYQFRSICVRPLRSATRPVH